MTEPEAVKFRAEVESAVALYKACVAAWRAHSLYDGDDRHPQARAVCRTREPETVSWSIDCLISCYAHLARMNRQRILAKEVEFTVEPIHPDDLVHPYRVLDYWRFPTKAGAKYAAKALFRELFPKLRPALTQACKLIREPAWLDPVTKYRQPKDRSFRLWMMREPRLARAAADMLVAPADIWEVANGKLSIEEVDKLGIRRYPILEQIEQAISKEKAAK